MQKRALLAGAASIAVLGTSLSAALAQTTGHEEDAVLETITVTAQKRHEDLQHVPITITAFDARTLEKMNITSTAELANAVPGFSTINSNGATLPFIRGLGVKSSGPWQEAMVSTYIDGVYYTNPDISAAVLNNLASVEVDKGPQGTLFGRNAVGGVVAYETKEPDQTTRGDFKVGYGNYNAWTASLYASTGITANLAADIAVAGIDQTKGPGKNLYNGDYVLTQWGWGARSKWVLKPSDNTKFTLIGDWGRTSMPNGSGIVRGEYSFINTGPSQYGGFYDTYSPVTPYRYLTQYGVSLKAEHDLDWAQLVSITAARHDTETKNGPYVFSPPFLPATPAVGQIPGLKTFALGHMFDKTLTQEFQVLSPTSSTIKWVGGAYFLFNRTGFDYLYNQTTVLPTGTRTSIATTAQKTQSYSAFAQATAPIFAGTRITAGVRYTSDHREVFGGSVKNIAVNSNVFANDPTKSVAINPEPSGTWSKPTFRAALEHDITDDILAYFSFSTGFQSAYYSISGGANGAPLQPQTIDAYEVGLKSNFFDNRMRANVALFQYDLQNIIVSHFFNGNQQQDNAAEGKVRGVDVDLTVKPLRDLTLTTAFSYLDPKYTNYPNQVAYTPNAAGSFDVVSINGTGYMLQYSEKFSGRVTASYLIPTPAGDFSLDGAVSHHSGAHYDTQNLNVQPPYTLVDASVTWASPSKPLEIKLWAKNLTAAKYATLNPANVQMAYFPGEPRTYGIQASYHLN